MFYNIAKPVEQKFDHNQNVYGEELQQLIKAVFLFLWTVFGVNKCSVTLTVSNFKVIKVQI